MFLTLKKYIIINIMKRTMKMPFLKKEPIFTLENGIGLLLAILIIFDLKVERNISNLLNTPLGIIFSFLFVILLFIFMNPIVGILFLIYLYDTIQTSDLSTILKDTKMKALNPIPQTQLEENVIKNKRPIINSGQHNNVSFQPYMSDSINMSQL
jgi:predicted membrane protein|tara:strand:+ start:522 stop:983 length:462 start_codon:yes stop_codon:yes gene_type:complete